MPAHRSTSPEKGPVRRPPSGKPATISGRKTSGERRRPRLLSRIPPRHAVLKNGQHEVRARILHTPMLSTAALFKRQR